MSQLEPIPLIVIVGPTAVGKSALALELALKFGLEIINADSMQVYRGMDIGSAKPPPADRNLVTHHLLDIRNPDEEYSAAQFREEAHRIISALAQAAKRAGDRRNRLNKALLKASALAQSGKRALVTGGTGLYIKALLKGLFPAPPADRQLRERLKKLEAEKGNWHLYRQLAEVDPEAASRIHPNDTFRIIRALEVFHLTGRTISEHHRDHRFSTSAFTPLKIGLIRDRREIYRRIEARVETMISSGLEEEVKGLLSKGYAHSIKAFQSLGYKQMLSHIRGKHWTRQYG